MSNTIQSHDHLPDRQSMITFSYQHVVVCKGFARFWVCVGGTAPSMPCEKRYCCCCSLCVHSGILWLCFPFCVQYECGQLLLFHPCFIDVWCLSLAPLLLAYLSPLLSLSCPSIRPASCLLFFGIFWGGVVYGARDLPINMKYLCLLPFL